MKYLLSDDHVSGTMEDDTKTNDIWLLTWRGSESIQVTSIISTMIKGYTESYSSSEEVDLTLPDVRLSENASWKKWHMNLFLKYE